MCDSQLDVVDNTVNCANRHTFDVARDGYVNLLAATGRAPRTPGDAKEMIQARTRFVGRGFYQSLVLAVGEIVHRAAGDMIGQAHPSILDVGCCEGYPIRGATDYLARRLHGCS